MLCITQLGPVLVLAPAVGWLYWSGDHLWASVLRVIALVISTLDKVLRPMLIRVGPPCPCC